jgi:hypothetical protein
MEERVLLGRGQNILTVPQAAWKGHLAQVPQHSQDRLSFMTAVHHQVRRFAVKALVDQQKPLAPEWIATQLGLPPAQVKRILEELERKLFFLTTDAQGAVNWAYPVSVETTPHKLKFSSGESLYAA